MDRFAEQWAVERPELDVGPMLVIGRLHRLAEILDQRLRPPIAAAGLGNGDFDVLAALRRARAAVPAVSDGAGRHHDGHFGRGHQARRPPGPSGAGRAHGQRDGRSGAGDRADAAGRRCRSACIPPTSPTRTSCSAPSMTTNDASWRRCSASSWPASTTDGDRQADRSCQTRRVRSPPAPSAIGAESPLNVRDSRRIGVRRQRGDHSPEGDSCVRPMSRSVAHASSRGSPRLPRS